MDRKEGYIGNGFSSWEDDDNDENDYLSPIRGDFVPVPSRTRSRSTSPVRRIARQPVHLQEDLPETHVDRGGNTTRSQEGLSRGQYPVDQFKHGHSPSLPSSSRVDNGIRGYTNTEREPGFPRTSPQYHHPSIRETHSREESTFSQFISSHSPQWPGAQNTNIAERRQQVPPLPIHVHEQPKRVTVVDPSEKHVCVSQQRMVRGNSGLLAPGNNTSSVFDEDDNVDSEYSDSDPGEQFHASARVTPLKLSPRGYGNVAQNKNISGEAGQKGYQNWNNSNDDAVPPAVPSRSPTLATRRAQFERRGLTMITSLEREPLYSPLTPYFVDKELPRVRKASKALFGDNGWLERTEKSPPKKKESRGVLDSLRKMARGMSDLTTSRRSHEGERKKPVFSPIAISLDPREQSLLYCELEFYISCAIQGYITVQLNHGRLDADKLKKVADGWVQRGRPKVVAFRYDLETQLELITLHVNDFRFYGRRQGSPAEISGLLHAMKVNARAMAVRTFCQPDSVVAKQLVDSQSLFNLLGVPDTHQVALQHVAQFFKVIVERESASRHQRDNAGLATPLVAQNSGWAVNTDRQNQFQGHDSVSSLRGHR